MASRALQLTRVRINNNESRIRCLSQCGSFQPHVPVASPRTKGAGHDEIRRAAVEGAELFRPAHGQLHYNAAAEAETAVAAPGASRSAEFFADLPCHPMDGPEFEMQGYLDMAQGMLIEPPPMAGLSSWAEDDFECEVNLWSY
ncbi:hypothetical protein ABZP36_003930 [Zizania latifolia]